MTAGRKAGGKGERGMVLLILLFLAAVVLIGASVGAERLVTQSRRQKEEETIWRGGQYVRAIRLYYRKYGQFPKSIDDFSKNPGNLHFLRKVYKDPMNGSDGTWRFIYMGPNGQLIGSLTRKLPIGMVALGIPQTALGAGGPGQGTSPFGSSFGAASGTGAGSGGASGFGSSSFGNSGGGTSGFGSSGFGSSGSGSSGFGSSGFGGGTGTNTPGASGGGIGGTNGLVNTGGQAQAGSASGTQTALDTGLAPVYGDDTSNSTGMPADFGGVAGTEPGPVLPPKKAIEGAQAVDGQVFGGQLVGVASKVDRKSIRFYRGYGKYREWEFIWDPAEEAAAAGNLPTGTGVLPAGIGTPPTGAPATGIQPLGNPPPTGTPTQPPQ
jgi:type II secretory pathway pseudopilin PulG